MDAVLRAAACAVCAAVLTLLIRKTNPELGLLLTLAAGLLILALAAKIAQPLRELIRSLIELSGMEAAVLSPVLKCVCIGIVTGLSGQLCRDAGQSYLAGAVEILGCAAAFCTAAPLFTALLHMIGELL